MILEGDVSVKAAMLGGRRQVIKIYLDRSRHDKDAHFVERKAEELGIPVEKVSREEIDGMAKGRTHGGMLCEAGERVYQSLSETLQKEHPFLVLVEGVEDPFNLGYIMRSLYSAGCDGLLLRKRSWSNVEDTILKSSAGASEYLSVVLCEDVAEAVREVKRNGLHVYAAMRKDALVYTEPDYTGGTLLMIGGEMRGLSSGVRAEADRNIYIPYANDFRNALNAAGAAAVLGFEVLRQRSAEGKR